MKIGKVLNLFALAMGFAGVACLTLILIFNQGFYVGTTRFIPESNQFIRITEIGVGMITTPILGKIIWKEIKNE